MNPAPVVLPPVFTLPPLPFAPEALEPLIDRETMLLHHDKHHAAYVTNLNKALEDLTEPHASLEEVLAHVSRFPPAVRNNAGGHYNHSLFWELLTPVADRHISATFAALLIEQFGSMEKLQEEFGKKALSVFGSGWAWLTVQDGKLRLTATPNQDSPLMDVAPEPGFPLLGLDVWEHAYYLKYQNRRADYVAAFWHLVNWPVVEARYRRAIGKAS